MIFLDSTFLIGLLLKRDNYNKLAKQINLPAGEMKIINNIVLNEILNSVG